MHPQPIVQRDDGRFEIGLIEALGPFETRQFAESVAHAVARAAWASAEHQTLAPLQRWRPR